jgi:hypothetical protein
MTLVGVSQLSTPSSWLDPRIFLPSIWHDPRKQLASTKTHTCSAWHTVYALKASAIPNKDVLHVFFILGVDQYIIDEHHDKLVQILHKNLVHQIHKVDWGISRSKRHHRILIQTIPHDKGNLWYVNLLYLQLMIFWSKINHTLHKVNQIDHQS